MAAGSERRRPGKDPQPWFRLQPDTQARRRDPNSAYIRRWVPELADVAGDVHDPGPRVYMPRIVDYASARGRAVAAYEAAARG